MIVGKILDEESEENRYMLYCYYWEEMTLAEVAKTVGMSIEGVRKRIETSEKRARLKWG